MGLPALEEARYLVAEYQTSGLSCEEFAKSKGLSAEQLSCWERRVERSERIIDQVKLPSTSFVEVKPSPVGSEILRVECAGVPLGIPREFDHQTMTQFLRALIDASN